MNSKSLETYLLKKFQLEKIEDLKFEEVEELLLNKIGNNGKELDYDFRDFEAFKNLKYISLQNFKINNYETNELGRCKKLSAIQFSDCNLKSKSRIRGNIKVVSFNNCKNFKIRYLSLLRNLEVLKVSNFRKVNLKGSYFYLKNLEKVYFENVTIYHLGAFSKLKKLSLVQLVNCQWNRKALRLFSKNVQIEE